MFMYIRIFIQVPSRRSDIESLIYCLVYWATGDLPWARLRNSKQIIKEKCTFLNHDLEDVLYMSCTKIYTSIFMFLVFVL